MGGGLHLNRFGLRGKPQRRAAVLLPSHLVGQVPQIASLVGRNINPGLPSRPGHRHIAAGIPPMAGMQKIGLIKRLTLAAVDRPRIAQINIREIPRIDGDHPPQVGPHMQDCPVDRLDGAKCATVDALAFVRCEFACNNAPLRGENRVQFRPL